MAFNKDRMGEEIQVMTPDDIIAVGAGNVDVANYTTVMFDVPVIIDGAYSLAANTPFGLIPTRTTISIDVGAGMMAMRR